MTDSHEQDPSQVPVLLAQIDREIDRFIGDGIYDQGPVYATVEAHSPSASVIIPPRKDAVLSPRGATAPTQRDRHLLKIERAGRFDWKLAECNPSSAPDWRNSRMEHMVDTSTLSTLR